MTLTCHQLTITRDSRRLLSGIDLTLFAGTLTILHGPNGSGKTSLLRAIAGIDTPAEGYIERDADLRIGYLGHHNSMHDDISVIDNIAWWARLTESELSISAAVHFWQLTERIECRYAELSAGWKQRVALASIMASGTDIWVLDEPDIHLDAVGMQLLQQMLVSKIMNGGMVLWASHATITEPAALFLDITQFQTDRAAHA